jgi:hypothetical protein
MEENFDIHKILILPINQLKIIQYNSRQRIWTEVHKKWIKDYRKYMRKVFDVPSIQLNDSWNPFSPIGKEE